MTCGQNYNPSKAASDLRSQGSSTSPHGPGGKVPMAKDSVRAAGMGHSPSKVGAVLNRQAPSKDGPMKSY